MNWPHILHECRGSAAEVRQRLASLNLPVDRLCADAPEPHPDEPYGRAPLYVGPEGEVILMRWRPGGVSAPHDHGGAGGFVMLLQGIFGETFWRFDGEDLSASPEHRVAAPEIVPVNPHAIHSMASLDGGVSLHIYTPAVEGMRVYDLDRRRTLVVADDCGAWVPRNHELIISASAWA